MTAPAPWQCPACSAWIAPHVTEHRCDPPASGVNVAPGLIGGPPGGWSVTGDLVPPGSHITVNVQGSVTSEQDLVRAIQKGLQKNANRNWRP